MITLVRGRLAHRTPDLVEIVTEGGVGYDVRIPISVFGALPDDGAEVTLHTHLAVREDAWELYGFGSRHERTVFRRLLDAKGVGPALALAILSALGAAGVVDALRMRDIAALVRAPRVGRRKAEQIILDLAEKVDDLVGVDAGSSPARRAARAVPGDDSVRALVALGYAAADAERAVAAVAADGPSDVSSVVRRALAMLAG